MKKCSKCYKNKPVSDFYFQNKKENIRKCECKSCSSFYNAISRRNKVPDSLKFPSGSKKCRVCKNYKPLTEYNFSNKALEIRAGECGECSRLRGRNYIKSLDEKRIEEIRKRDCVYKKRNSDFVFSYLESNPCERCGEDDIRVLEFNHLEPEKKKYSICNMINDLSSIKKIKSEIEKCEVLCIFCHFDVTLKQIKDKREKSKVEISSGSKASNKIYKRGKRYVESIKEESSCVSCGEDRNRFLEFDHIKGDKHSEVSAMLNYSLKRIQEEIDKCQSLCKKCHRIKTLKDQNSLRHQYYLQTQQNTEI